MSAPLPPLEPATISEIVEMALADHVSFEWIRLTHGLSPDQVKALMRRELKPGSYKAWRRRVRTFSDRWGAYKSGQASSRVPRESASPTAVAS